MSRVFGTRLGTASVPGALSAFRTTEVVRGWGEWQNQGVICRFKIQVKAPGFGAWACSTLKRSNHAKSRDLRSYRKVLNLFQQKGIVFDFIPWDLNLFQGRYIRI